MMLAEFTIAKDIETCLLEVRKRTPMAAAVEE